MGEETARLRREIDRTREDLTRDVDMITEKTSPSRIVERRVEKTRRGISGLKDRIMGHGDDTSSGYGAPSSDPYGAGYYGAGYADTGYADAGYGEQTGDRSRSGGSGSAGMGERLRGGVDSARESVSGATSTMTDRASGAVHGVQGTAHDTVRSARQQTEGNPMAAGIVAFGVGWLVSSLLPASDREVDAARRAQEKAKEHGGPIAEQARQAAAEIGENLKGSAQEAVEQVKGHAQEAAQTVKDEGASAARTVKDEGTSAAQTVTSDAKDKVSSGASASSSGSTAGSEGMSTGTSGLGAEGTSTTTGSSQGQTY